jgi:hypothetical protein
MHFSSVTISNIIANLLFFYNIIFSITHYYHIIEDVDKNVDMADMIIDMMTMMVIVIVIYDSSFYQFINKIICEVMDSAIS